MFERLSDIQDPVRFTFEGATITCERGDSIAVALLASGVKVFRKTPVSGAARGPFCLMGACFDCLVSINGVTVQACMTEARDGMVVSYPAIPESIA